MADDNIQVQFGAQTGDLDSGVDHAKDKIAEISDPVDSIIDKFGEIAAAIAAAFTVDKIAEFIKGTAEAAEQIERLQDITGLTTDTIQTMQYAMQLTGGNAEQAGMMMSRLERNIYNAAAGAGPAYDAFSKLHVSLDLLQHGTPDQILFAMADGFKAIPDAAERAQIAITLMGRAGANMLEIFLGGKEKLEELSKQFDETGDKMSPDMTKKFAEVDKDIVNLEDSIQGLGRQLEFTFVEQIKTSIEWLTNLAKTLQQVSITAKDTQLPGVTVPVGGPNQAQMALMGDTGMHSPAGMVNELNDMQSILGPPQTINRNQEGQDATAAAKAAAAKAAADAEAKAAQDEADKELAIRKEAIDQEIKLTTSNYTQFAATQDLMVSKGEETADQALAAKIDALTKERDAVKAEMETEAKLYGEGTLAYQQEEDKKVIAAQRFNTEIIRLQTEQQDKENEAAKKSEKSWTDAFDKIGSTFDTMLTGVLQGTQTIGQAFARMAGNLIITFAEAVARIIALNAILVVANDQGWVKISGAVTKSLGDFVLVEQQKTGATVAGNAERVASDTSAAAASSTVDAAGASSQIMKDAYEAAANVYADVSAIPYVGWILAPPAAAAAFAAVAAFDSFDVGTPNVPQDMLAQVHQGEAIVPAKQAQAWRDGDLGLGANSSSGDVHLHVHAIDASGVKQFFLNNKSAVASAVQSAIRSNHRGLMSTARGMA
jgi:hypothetical protein